MMMLANSVNLRRAGLLLRAMSSSAGWTSGHFVDARKTAKESAIAATERELVDAEGYLVEQGWVKADAELDRGAGWYALTRHGLEESQRKAPGEPKPPRPTDRA
jgi:hypothetical protein